jgi:excisionase family DNA binding protein
MGDDQEAMAANECRTSDVARALRISNQTVVNWAEKGVLPCSRTAGGHRRFLRTDVVALARQKNRIVPSGFCAPSGRKVLVVDDDPYLSDSVSQYLVRLGGLEVEAARSWFQFGRALERHAPDVILLDLRMPGENGLDVCRMLHTDPRSRHIRVIAWMAAHEDGLDDRVRETPFAAVVRKPGHLDDLLRRVQSLLAA